MNEDEGIGSGAIAQPAVRKAGWGSGPGKVREKAHGLASVAGGAVLCCTIVLSFSLSVAVFNTRNPHWAMEGAWAAGGAAQGTGPVSLGRYVLMY